MTFRLRYLVLTIVLFVTEVLIALYVHDDFVRPYVGDLLVVILIYAFGRTFFKISVNLAAVGTLAFAFFVEFLQFFQIVDKLDLRGNKVARVVIGTSFAWEDLAMYVAGMVIVLLVEKLRSSTALGA
ncbi:DUF2809 domain-containing protein [Flavobacterium sp. MAH-1]|uniref:DUF2809 domain-containing protein n=1 Tax=Flavobacterium agri TaxID=2743471 RepID=A0A7Y9C5H2_9FLAO|nr:DUF2809 domain-containing protein [Flavobacterium agri]NUY81287.1 DUF2809 domain-containing protein [Flavobacterium agri]NYA71311.1 DUF2809 domain-containing protein [Flavobacterium agri]